MKVEEHQKDLISGRILLFDLPETPVIADKIKINLENGEIETL